MTESDITAIQDDDDGFVGRWSRLKRQSADDPVETPPAMQPPGIDGPASELELTDQDMPPLENLTAESDFTPFLSPKVSESLRRLALRKLFHDDAFNLCDGLDDYAEDFTGFSGMAGLVTADMKYQLERLLQKEWGEGVEDTIPADEATLAAATAAEDAPPSTPLSKAPAVDVVTTDTDQDEVKA